MVNVAILGYGTVGSGVFEVINKNNSHISRRAGDDVNVKYVLDLEISQEIQLSLFSFTTSMSF